MTDPSKPVAWRRRPHNGANGWAFTDEPEDVSHYEQTGRYLIQALYLGSDWVELKDAPLGVFGLVWSPSFPDRTDLRGTVHAYDDGERFASSPDATGDSFTHYHPLPIPPSVK